MIGIYENDLNFSDLMCKKAIRSLGEIRSNFFFFIIHIQVHIHGKSWLYISLDEMENTETNGNEKMNKKVQNQMCNLLLWIGGNVLLLLVFKTNFHAIYETTPSTHSLTQQHSLAINFIWILKLFALRGKWQEQPSLVTLEAT